jgi:tetratricopeptide (TPR) repeat protein
MSSPDQPMRDRRGRVYTPAIGPRLRPLLWIVLIGFALLGANGVYLASVTAMTWLRGSTQQTFFYMLMVAFHLFIGLALVVPFIAFGVVHLVTSRKRLNKRAIRVGYLLLAASVVVLISGLVLVRIGGFEVRDPRIRNVGYWLHVAGPLLAIALYYQHRLAGPRIRWHWARRFGVAVAGFVVLMGLLHSQDPRSFGVKGPKEGKKYFYPSEAVTANGKFIPAQTLMMDDYCLKCHKDAYNGWFHSAHHLSSFNNPAYLSSVRETRKVSLERDGTTQAARWCAGCHDPVPFFSGEFDDPNYDDVHNPTSQAGITCTVCHAITTVNNTRGNGAYTIDEPQHYPFAFSENPVLQWINQTLVKAKPEMHKQTFLKPAIQTNEFCSTCHKVGLPFALNHYKDFLRGQNHYDTFLLSGVSGHGARSFYYPPVAKSSCVECHMTFQPSTDFGAKDFDGKGGRKIHDHFFVAANTALAVFQGDLKLAEPTIKFLTDRLVRVDLFGLREGGVVEGKLLGPIRPETPTLKKGRRYLAETVVRTLALGHPFSQGTVDSNEIWVELIAKAGDKIIGRSGGMGPDGAVDPYSHFVNVYMLDRDGNRIDRRNPQDIFVPLYNKQIPPGAGQVVHFGLDVPEDVAGPITLEARLNYRKFDRTYLDHVYGKGKGPEFPVVVMARDSVTLGIEGGPPVANDPSPIKEVWQRWNDYGIGLLLEGGNTGGQKGELKQAEEAFRKVAELGRADGWVNLARVYQKEGRIPEALAALEKAAKHKEPAAPWVINWLTGQINARNGHLDEAIASFESVLKTKIPERKFDFSRDYEVNNELASALYGRARIEPVKAPERIGFLDRAIAAYRHTLSIDTENVAAHYGLGLAFSDPAWAALQDQHVDPGLVTPDTSRMPATGDMLVELADRTRDPKRTHSDRAGAALRYEGVVVRYLEGDRPEYESRLEPLHDAAERLGEAWALSAEYPALRAGLVRPLELTHEALHKFLKPDETAQGRAFALARKRDPAANSNAQSIVIHSLHRPGAPGMNSGRAATAKAANHHPSAGSSSDQKGGG